MPDRPEIPPEHTAARSLEESFRALGEEKARSRRRGVRRGRLRAAGAAAVTIAVVSGATAVGTRVLSSDESLDSRGVATGELARVPADRRLALARAADPVDPWGWGLRVYQGAIGDTCVVVGRVLRGRLGVMHNGTFSELAADAPGQCADVQKERVLIAVRHYRPGAGVQRTVLYGVADRRVSAMSVTTTHGVRPVAIASDGTYLFVVAGDHGIRAVTIFSGRSQKPTTRKLL